MRTALVTGGSEGIGLVVAERMAAAGHRVAIAARSQKGLAKATERLGLPAERLMTLAMDVTDDASVRRALQTLNERWPAVEILVNNAGLMLPPVDFVAGGMERMRSSMEANFFGTALLCRELVPAMREAGWGRIVNVTSSAAFGGPPGLVAYATAKAAVIAFTRVLAVELAEHGICVNAVAPGPTATPNWAGPKSAAFLQARARAVPSGRLGTAGDTAAAIAFLASPEAAHITGQVLGVDGGEMAAGTYTALLAARREPSKA